MFYFYILQSEKLGKYYYGASQNLQKRILAHNKGKSKFTSRAIDWVLIYWEGYPARAATLNREKQIKAWKKRSRIEALIQRNPIDHCKL